jgi:hypothetical protein
VTRPQCVQCSIKPLTARHGVHCNSKIPQPHNPAIHGAGRDRRGSSHRARGRGGCGHHAAARCDVPKGCRPRLRCRGRVLRVAVVEHACAAPHPFLARSLHRVERNRFTMRASSPPHLAFGNRSDRDTTVRAPRRVLPRRRATRPQVISMSEEVGRTIEAGHSRRWSGRSGSVHGRVLPV